jgi:hypothetical protein
VGWDSTERRKQMDVKVHLLRFADGVRHIRRCVEQDTLSEEEASEMVEKLADFYSGQIGGASGQPEAAEDCHKTSVTEQGPAIAPEIGPGDAAEGASAPEHDGAEAVSLLMELGIETLTAQQLASQCSLEEIEGWVRYAWRSKGLTNPAGLVVSRLRERVPAPRPPDEGAQRRRQYLTGTYAHHIAH